MAREQRPYRARRRILYIFLIFVFFWLLVEAASALILLWRDHKVFKPAAWQNRRSALLNAADPAAAFLDIKTPRDAFTSATLGGAQIDRSVEVLHPYLGFVWN